MQTNYKELAIIGTTASGKTSLAIEIAQKTNSIILSIDSLAVFKEIDIASAKPTPDERENILHFGIDEIYPNEPFDVSHFLNLYKKAKQYAIDNSKIYKDIGWSPKLPFNKGIEITIDSYLKHFNI